MIKMSFKIIMKHMDYAHSFSCSYTSVLTLHTSHPKFIMVDISVTEKTSKDEFAEMSQFTSH